MKDDNVTISLPSAAEIYPPAKHHHSITRHFPTYTKTNKITLSLPKTRFLQTFAPAPMRHITANELMI
ncbi:hypothetical protein [uncultured Ruminococcus sp.]|uniref:hypothetical protein n=1 Tax=uncultured Ruminococcus sp. TaxID=165186 RepID=UPI0025FBD095|nr:hypothetical protein [uncultured Ruminococcus sp.]